MSGSSLTVLVEIYQRYVDQAAEVDGESRCVLDFAAAIEAQVKALRLHAIARSTEHLCREQLLSIASLAVAALVRDPATTRPAGRGICEHGVGVGCCRECECAAVVRDLTEGSPR